MLSVLIPVYNSNVVSLVTTIHTQAVSAALPFEIILLDDCSSAFIREHNQPVVSLPCVRYYELKSNAGRARIRNMLAGMAVYNSLLFIDCDAEVPSDSYIKNYLPWCNKEIVVYGGRIYQNIPPGKSEYLLHWRYGLQAEQKSEEVRKRAPYLSFMTNNFLVSKTIMSNLSFDESITLYGHEDTLFGLELSRKGIPVEHIRNPLLHAGLENAIAFLGKTTDGIGNLIMLVNNNKISPAEYDKIRLLNSYELTKKYGLTGFYRFCFSVIEKKVLRNLKGNHPLIFLFNLYKLYLFIKLMKAGSTNN